ncbi:hypothetical protein AvCA_16930 [Azotobacter vinelandii CA]|uniref:Uncharacterized protein n=2 Tax=Azotobacter vinelandii TaxID=354 RepID=C1DSF2_AZOVD|nr:hypothetical protein Avin_16930 [Azotobacter vinelandii DJ]AGK15225.1 hypothetical protein AvCA_16930 [Azotobacter vinelandii CA]AGK20071.1 hypothetical protein AvCA6_16930 [Azotobacter vinelandii CA6]
MTGQWQYKQMVKSVQFAGLRKRNIETTRASRGL